MTPFVADSRQKPENLGKSRFLNGMLRAVPSGGASAPTHETLMTQTARTHVDLAERHKAEAVFHDHKYATGDSFPRHYKVNPTAPVLERMLAMLGRDLTGKRVLEYGCGDGWITVKLARLGAHVSAFDISPEAVSQTNATLHAEGLGDRCSVQVMAGEKLEYPDASFDVVVGFAILHHLEMTAALAELHRVLKADGKALFAEPLASNPLISLYRRLTPQYRTVDEAPIELNDFARRASAFRRFRHQDQLLLASAALGLCYVPGCAGVARWGQRGLMRVDDALLRVAPWAGRWAWYSILELDK
jgi:2-polyprenyl-3-methyl-5-hydroxy-6-metoxy-1,4-benzoquinol methylase